MAKKKNAKLKQAPAVNRGYVCVALVLLAAAGYFVARRAPAPLDLAESIQPDSAAGFNLLLVTLDTVRADHLGCYGYEPARTPTIDALAARGLQFDQAVTPTPLTLPSHATMLTGLYPPRHGVRGNGNFELAARHVTLAESLKEKGYDTAAFIGCFVLDERFGLNQGFDVYDFEVSPDGFDRNNLNMNQRPADAVSDSAIQWLRERSSEGAASPFFMWVHYFDAHKPYQSPYVKLPAFDGRPYDAEIAYIDSQLKRLLDELDRRGLREKTLIALVSDHGEGLGEHDESTHGLLLYESTLRVAFILSNPALFDGPLRVSDRLVCLTDLAPTLTELLGLPAVESDGISAASAPFDSRRSVFIETQVPFYAARCSPLYGLRSLEDKYIRAPEPEYYELPSDPGELVNLHDRRYDQIAALDARLTDLLDAWSDAARDGLRTLAPEEAARLSALGYVQTVSDDVPDNLPDPKAMLRANNKIGEALQLIKANRLNEALQVSREAVSACPAFPDAAETLAAVCEMMNRPEDALDALRTCFQLNPKSRTAVLTARLLLMLKRYDEVGQALKTAERLDPGDGLIYLLRGDLFVSQKRLKEAVTQYEHALQVDEHRIGLIARPQLEKIKEMLKKP